MELREHRNKQDVFSQKLEQDVLPETGSYPKMSPKGGVDLWALHLGGKQANFCEDTNLFENANTMYQNPNLKIIKIKSIHRLGKKFKYHVF